MVWCGSDIVYESGWNAPRSTRRLRAVGRPHMEGGTERPFIWNIVSNRSEYHRQILSPSPPSSMRWAMVSFCTHVWHRSVSVSAILLRWSFVGSRSCITTYHSERSTSVIPALCKLRCISVQFKLGCIASTLMGLALVEAATNVCRVAYVFMKMGRRFLWPGVWDIRYVHCVVWYVCYCIWIGGRVRWEWRWAD
jgi:hypothetical protein